MATGSGDWAGEDGKLARFMANPGYWQFSPAKAALNRVDGLLYLNTASGWQIANRPATLPQITGDTSTDLAGVVGQMLGWAGLEGVLWVC